MSDEPSMSSDAMRRADAVVQEFEERLYGAAFERAARDGKSLVEVADVDSVAAEILRPHLTDEQREAVSRAIAMLNGGQQFGGDTPLAGDAAVLRGLLEGSGPTPSDTDTKLEVRTVSEPGAVLEVKAAPIPPKIQSMMAEAIRGER